MTNEVHIRQAVPEDVPALMGLILTAMTQYAHHSGITTLLDSQKETAADVLLHVVEDMVLVAESRGHLAGTVRLTIQPDGTAYFSRFAVYAQRQQSGIGKHLFEAAEIYLRQAGVTEILLHTAINNKPLVGLYTARGFELVSVSHDRGYARGTFRKMMVKDPAAAPEFQENCAKP